MKLEGQTVRLLWPSRSEAVEVLRCQLMQPGEGQRGSFVLLYVTAAGEIDQVSVGDARVELVKPPPIKWVEVKSGGRDVLDSVTKSTTLADALRPAFEQGDAVAAPTQAPDLSAALAQTAEERDKFKAAYEKLAAEAEGKVKALQRQIAMLTTVPAVLPSMTEGTHEEAGLLCYSGTITPHQVVPTTDGAAYHKWAMRLVAERNQARKQCMELEARIVMPVKPPDGITWVESRGTTNGGRHG